MTYFRTSVLLFCSVTIGCSDGSRAHRDLSSQNSSESDVAESGGLELSQPSISPEILRAYPHRLQFKLEISAVPKCALNEYATTSPVSPDLEKVKSPDEPVSSDGSAQGSAAVGEPKDSSTAVLNCDADSGKKVHSIVTAFEAGKVHRIGKLPDGVYIVDASILDHKQKVLFMGRAISSVKLGNGKVNVKLTPVDNSGFVVTTEVVAAQGAGVSPKNVDFCGLANAPVKEICMVGARSQCIYRTGGGLVISSPIDSCSEDRARQRLYSKLCGAKIEVPESRLRATVMCTTTHSVEPGREVK